MKALIIDDDQTYLIIIEALLSMQNETVDYLQINDPVKALELLQTEDGKSFDKILLDINMPSINGWEFLDEMKKMNIQKKVFMLTSSIDLYDMERSRLYPNIVGYYVKPILKEQLTDIINYK